MDKKKVPEDSGEISRRELVLGAGAGGILTPGREGPVGPAEPAGPKGQRRRGVPAYVLPVAVAPSKGVLVVDERICMGCMTCMYACTLTKDAVACPDLARIKLSVHTLYEFDVVALPCMQCVDPQCLRYCPTGAIKVDEKTGARVIEERSCIGCQNCIAACPYDIPRISFDVVKMKATKCDLCGGDPACVKACPTEALSYYYNPDGVRSGYVQAAGGHL